MPTEVKVPKFPESVEEGTVMSWHKAEGDTVQRDEKLVDIETDKVVIEVAAQADGVLAKILVPEGETVVADQVLGTMGEAGEGPAAPAEAQAEAKTPEPTPEPEAPVVPVATVPEPATVKEAPAPPPPPPSLPPALTGDRPEERVPMTRLRARVAQRLKEAQQTAAILTTFNEVNMQAIMDLRGRYKDKFAEEHGVKLGFMSFFVKAAVEALKKFPVVNASVDGTDIVYHGYFDIGIAISAPRGLVVPILRDADQLSFAEIERSIVDYATRARENKLEIEELMGGTFTITNGGIFGSMLSTPIINPPQSAILGMHKIQERPVAEKGQVVVRPIMYLALSYDHRLVDGRDSVQFLVTMKETLEDPSRMLLSV